MKDIIKNKVKSITSGLIISISSYSAWADFTEDEVKILSGIITKMRADVFNLEKHKTSVMYCREFANTLKKDGKTILSELTTKFQYGGKETSIKDIISQLQKEQTEKTIKKENNNLLIQKKSENINNIIQGKGIIQGKDDFSSIQEELNGIDPDIITWIMMNPVNTTTDATLFHIVALKANEDIGKNLLEHIKNLPPENKLAIMNAKNNYGATPLNYATYEEPLPFVTKDNVNNADDNDAKIKALLDFIKDLPTKNIFEIINAQNNYGFSPFFAVVNTGRGKCVKAFLDFIKNLTNLTVKDILAIINMKRKDGWTPLLVVATIGNEEIANTLLTFIKNLKDLTPNDILDIINENRKDGLTLLHHIARWNNNKNVVKPFLELIKDLPPENILAIINAKDENGFTPLHSAIALNNKNVVKPFLELIKDLPLKDILAIISAKGMDDYSLLHCAAEAGHTAIVNAFLDFIKKLKDLTANDILPIINAKDKKGFTPLHRAAGAGHTAIVNAFLDFIEKLKDLTANDTLAIINAQGKCNFTPLRCGIENIDIVNAFLGFIEKLKGLKVNDILAIINAKDENGFTSLHQATKDGNTDIVNALLTFIKNKKLTANDILPIINAQDIMGWSPLHLGSGLGHKDTVENLLKFIDDVLPGEKANIVNLQDKKGQTPLYWAIYYGKEDIVSLLLKNGAVIDVNIFASLIKSEKPKKALEWLSKIQDKALLEKVKAYWNEHSKDIPNLDKKLKRKIDNKLNPKEESHKSGNDCEKTDYSNPSLQDMLSSAQGSTFTQTAQNKSRQGKKTIKEEDSSEILPKKQTKEDIQIGNEPIHILFNLTPGVRSKVVTPSMYDDGREIINTCNKVLFETGINFSFKQNSQKHWQLKCKSLPDFAEAFFNSHKKPCTIPPLHKATQLCTDHFNRLISYLVNFMCIVVEKEVSGYEECLKQLKRFNEQGQLDKKLLPELYPLAWGKIIEKQGEADSVCK